MQVGERVHAVVLDADREKNIVDLSVLSARVKAARERSKALVR